MKRSAQDTLEDRERNFVTFEMNNNSRVDESKSSYRPVKSSNLIYESNRSSNERVTTDDVNRFSQQDEDDGVNKNSIPSITRSISNGVDVGVYIQEEIHPGIILEGYAVEI